MNMSEQDLSFIKYEKVFIPEIIKIQKDKLDNYTFIKTISAGSSQGHILKGKDNHFMCLSKNDYITIESREKEPLGFKRSDVNELYVMAASFDKAFANDKATSCNSNKIKWQKVVAVPVWDTSVLWHHRMHNKFLINVVTKEEIDLSYKSKQKIFDITGLSNHSLTSIVFVGIQAKNWCYKGERLDGKTWEEFFENKAKNYNPDEKYIHTCFKKNNSLIYFVNLRTTALDLGVTPEFLLQALSQNRDDVVGYKIINLTAQEYAQRLFYKTQSHQTQH
jgi:hypothetical protein